MNNFLFASLLNVVLVAQLAVWLILIFFFKENCHFFAKFLAQYLYYYCYCHFTWEKSQSLVRQWSIKLMYKTNVKKNKMWQTVLRVCQSVRACVCAGTCGVVQIPFPYKQFHRNNKIRKEIIIKCTRYFLFIDHISQTLCVTICF